MAKRIYSLLKPILQVPIYASFILTKSTLTTDPILFPRNDGVVHISCHPSWSRGPGCFQFPVCDDCSSSCASHITGRVPKYSTRDTRVALLYVRETHHVTGHIGSNLALHSEVHESALLSCRECGIYKRHCCPPIGIRAFQRST